MSLTLENITALASAGFSKNEILQVLQASMNQQAQQPIPQQVITPAQHVNNVPPQSVQPVNTGAGRGSAGQGGADQGLAELLRSMQGSINGLTNAVQAQNIQNSSIQTRTETVDDVLASIINPPVVDNK